MMKIEAIIRREKLEIVKAALDDLGIYGVTVLEVQGAGRQRGVVHHHRGSEYRVSLLPKLMLITVIPDDLVKAAVDTIIAGAHTGEIGDGKIFVTPVADVIRVRTGEHGETAIT